MSIHIMSAVWGVGGLSSTQKLVLLSLADQANDDGVCWPSISNIVRRCNMSERCARNAVRSLEKMGYLKCSHRGGHSNVYTVTPEPDAARHEMPGTPARGAAPPRHEMPGTPARGAAPPRHEMPGTPARGAARSPNDPSDDPSMDPARGPDGPVEGHETDTQSLNLEPERTAPAGKNSGYPEWFERIWSARPGRSGNDPKKAAYRAVKARIQEGEIGAMDAWHELARYAEWCRATGKAGTEVVMQTSTFFGPLKEGYKADWTVKEAENGAGGQRSGSSLADRLDDQYDEWFGGAASGARPEAHDGDLAPDERGVRVEVVEAERGEGDPG